MNRNFFKSEAMKVSLISVAVNLILSGFKLIAGIFGHSRALVADAAHSASDVLTTVVVMAALFISGKGPDEDHPYGHQKYESLASLFLGVLLGYVGIKIGADAIKSLVTESYKTAAKPGMLAAVAAAVSILVKEMMYHITMHVAKKERSNALKADAWHHRSDALSSIGSLVGVLFAGFGFPVMDAVASLVICIFILKTTVDIVWDAVKVLTDSSCDKKTEEAIRTTVREVPDVRRIDMLKTRRFGSGYYMDVEISVDGGKLLSEAHEVAEHVHDMVEQTYPEVLHCMVHVNPNA